MEEARSDCDSTSSASVCAFAGGARPPSDEESAVPPALPRSSVLLPRQPPLRVQALPQYRRTCMALLRTDPLSHLKREHFKAAIHRLGDSLQISESTQELAASFFERYAKRIGYLPANGERFKYLVSTTIFAAGIRQGLGITMGEVAARAGLTLKKMRHKVWRFCRMEGIRLFRGPRNVEALLNRMCQHFQMPRKRVAVVQAGAQIFAMASDGWITTGRLWANVVAGAFVLAARAYHFRVHPGDVARMICLREAMVRTRLREMESLLMSMLKLMPWGDCVTWRSLHVYVHFVLDYWDVLVPLLPELERQRREREKQRLPRGGMDEEERRRGAPAVLFQRRAMSRSRSRCGGKAQTTVVASGGGDSSAVRQAPLAEHGPPHSAVPPTLDLEPNEQRKGRRRGRRVANSEEVEDLLIH